MCFGNGALHSWAAPGSLPVGPDTHTHTPSFFDEWWLTAEGKCQSVCHSVAVVGMHRKGEHACMHALSYIPHPQCMQAPERASPANPRLAVTQHGVCLSLSFLAPPAAD